MIEVKSTATPKNSFTLASMVIASAENTNKPPNKVCMPSNTDTNHDLLWRFKTTEAVPREAALKVKTQNSRRPGAVRREIKLFVSKMPMRTSMRVSRALRVTAHCPADHEIEGGHIQKYVVDYSGHRRRSLKRLMNGRKQDRKTADEGGRENKLFEVCCGKCHWVARGLRRRSC